MSPRSKFAPTANAPKLLFKRYDPVFFVDVYDARGGRIYGYDYEDLEKAKAAVDRVLRFAKAENLHRRCYIRDKDGHVLLRRYFNRQPKTPVSAPAG